MVCGVAPHVHRKNSGSLSAGPTDCFMGKCLCKDGYCAGWQLSLIRCRHGLGGQVTDAKFASSWHRSFGLGVWATILVKCGQQFILCGSWLQRRVVCWNAWLRWRHMQAAGIGPCQSINSMMRQTFWHVTGVFCRRCSFLSQLV